MSGSSSTRSTTGMYQPKPIYVWYMQRLGFGFRQYPSMIDTQLRTPYYSYLSLHILGLFTTKTQPPITSYINVKRNQSLRLRSMYHAHMCSIHTV